MDGSLEIRNDGIGNHSVIGADDTWASAALGKYRGKNIGSNVYNYAMSPLELLYPDVYPTNLCFCQDANIFYNVDPSSIRCPPGDLCGACYPDVYCDRCSQIKYPCLTDPMWR